MFSWRNTFPNEDYDSRLFLKKIVDDFPANQQSIHFWYFFSIGLMSCWFLIGIHLFVRLTPRVPRSGRRSRLARVDESRSWNGTRKKKKRDLLLEKIDSMVGLAFFALTPLLGHLEYSTRRR